MKEYILIGGPFHLNKINLLYDVSSTTLKSANGFKYKYTRRVIYIKREYIVVYAHGEIDIDELYKLHYEGCLK